MEHSERIPARRMGGILAEARQDVGLSLEQVEELASGAVNARVLCAIERGRRRVDADELATLAAIYRLDPSSLTPVRRRFRIDVARGVIELDGIEHELSSNVAAPAAVVAEYLAMIRRARGTDISSPIALRSGDLAALSDALGQDRATLRLQLRTAIESTGVSASARPRSGAIEFWAPSPSPVEVDPGVIPPPMPDAAVEVEVAVDAQLQAVLDALADHRGAGAAATAPESSSPTLPTDAARTASTSSDLAVMGSTEVALPGEVRELEPDVMAELESVYDEIAALSSRRYHISKRRYRRRHRELLAREQELLGVLGFESWSTLIISIASGLAGLPLARSERGSAPVAAVVAPPAGLIEVEIERPIGAHFREAAFVAPDRVAMRTSWSEFVSVRVDGSPLTPVDAVPATDAAPEGFRSQFSTESLFVHQSPRVAGPAAAPAAGPADVGADVAADAERR